MSGSFDIVSELYNKTFRYLSNEINLESVEDWLTPRLDVILTTSPSNAHELVNLIELNRAEMSLGHRTEEDFRNELSRYVGDHPNLSIPLDDINIFSMSSSSTATVNGSLPDQALTFLYKQF